MLQNTRPVKGIETFIPSFFNPINICYKTPDPLRGLRPNSVSLIRYHLRYKTPDPLRGLRHNFRFIKTFCHCRYKTPDPLRGLRLLLNRIFYMELSCCYKTPDPLRGLRQVLLKNPAYQKLLGYKTPDPLRGGEPLRKRQLLVVFRLARRL